MLTRRFIERLKLWHEPQYSVALKAGVHPSLLSKWIIGAQAVRRGDPRAIAIGRLIGLEPDEVFLDDQHHGVVETQIPTPRGKRHQ